MKKMHEREEANRGFGGKLRSGVSEVLELLKTKIRFGGSDGMERRGTGRHEDLVMATMTHDEALHLMDVLILSPDDSTGMTDSLLRKLNSSLYVALGTA